MAFTKIAAPAGIDTSGSIVVNGINATGIITATSIIAGSASFSGNVSIAGTVTYEDVTNIDSIGIVTARSGIHVTGGSVGIGTTNPSQKLTVSNNILLGSSVSGATATPSYIDLGLNFSNGTTRDKLKIYLYNDTTGDTTQKYGFGLGGGGDVQYHSNITHDFYIANNSAVRISSNRNLLIGSQTETGTASQPLQVTGGAYVSGNLGVGVTNPGSSLTVKGSAIRYITTADLNTGIYLSASGSDRPHVSFRVSDNSERGKLEINGINGASGDRLGLYSFYSGNLNEVISIFGGGSVCINNTALTGTASQTLQVTGGAYVSGFVGIGTTNPQAPLHLIGTGAQVRWDNVAANDARHEYYRAGVRQGYINWDANILTLASTQSSGVLTFATGGTTERVRIDSSGNLGINTTSVSAKLQVHNNITTAYANISPTISNVTNLWSNSSPHVSGGTFVGAQYNLPGDGQNRIAYIGAISESASDRKSSLVFGTDEGGNRTEKVRITGDGNVGIATINPQARLSVGAGSLVDANVPVQISTQSATGLAYYGANNNGGYGALFGYDRNSYSGGVVRVVGATDNIDFIVNNTTRAVTIIPSGNTGIGITNPQAPLHVVGSGTTALLVSGNARITGILTVGTSSLTFDGNANTITGLSTITGSSNFSKPSFAGISSTITATATDVFVYDTRKDSDGGAWRKRTQHTSWYNETLNTATRGSRRDFPAVAVIVSEQEKVTIYDGDDPDMPMWMVFEGVTGSWKFAQYGNDSAVITVQALNGLLVIGNTGTVYGSLHLINFIDEFSRAYIGSGGSSGTLFKYDAGIIDRNVLGVTFSQVLPNLFTIVNHKINDVAMTVLPNAPIDSATGLPVPTIAVATAGGVNVLKDDGTVESTDNALIYKIGFIKGDRIAYGHRGGQSYEGRAINVAPFRNSFTYSFYDGNSIPHFGNSDLDAGYILGVGDGNVYGYAERGIRRIFEDEQNRNNGMANYITTSYNTGWMHGDIKGAFLSDTSTTSATGTALLTGQASTYDVNTTNGGWTSQASASNAYNATNGVGGSGCIRLTSPGGSNIWNSLSLGTVISGEKYSITFSAKIASSAATLFTVSQSQYNVNAAYGSITPTVTTSHATYSFIFTASSTTAWLNVYAGNGSGSALDIDNIDVRLLSEADRSVNNKGLAVYGTITKTAVATGADLVAYGGFSISNYLLQPYNSAIAFGTADFSYMGWAKATTAGGYLFQWDNPNSASGIRISMFNSTTVRVTVTSVVDRDITYSALTGTWNFFVVQRVGSIIYTYINGVQIDSFSNTTNLSGTDKVLTFGYDGNNTLNLALWRVSASAPSPDQIKKIYNDEKMLFQANSKSTLYGSSNVVTGIAYDDTTKLLHVGTSSGRSEFQGLERINNTTTAVTTAISASNGLVAEQ